MYCQWVKAHLGNKGHKLAKQVTGCPDLEVSYDQILLSMGRIHECLGKRVAKNS